MSKEAILGQAAGYGMIVGEWFAWIPFSLFVVTAFMTGFYMFRLYWLTFWGPPGNQHAYDHAHESGPKMAWPLRILAVLAIISAGIASPFGAEYLGGHWFQNKVNDDAIVKEFMIQHADSPESKLVFESQSVHMLHHHHPEESASEVVKEFHENVHHIHYYLLGLSLLMVVFGVGASWVFFVRLRGKDLIAPIKPLVEYRRVLKNLYYVDWFLSNPVVTTFKEISVAFFTFDKKIIDGTVNLVARFVGRDVGWFFGAVDKRVVDGSVNGVGSMALSFGNLFRGMITGRIQDYVKFTMLCMGVLLIWALWS
jgi:NADH-quinone oxidoreductase subunit L